MKLLTLALPLTLVVLGSSVNAWQPAVANAKLETRAHSGSLAAELRRVAGPAWVGYAVAAEKAGSNSCCWNDHSRGCGLENDHKVKSGSEGRSVPTKPVKLEGSNELAVLFRMSGGAIDKVSVYSIDCELDAGGLPFIWLTGVSAAESAAVLKDSTEKGALVALALQGGKEAESALIGLAREAQTGHRRGEALFWLAQRASDKAIGAISQAIEDDPDTGVKKQAVFALSQLPKDEGVPKLIEVARTNHNPAVRKQAFFWLGQSNDPRAFHFLEETLAR